MAHTTEPHDTGPRPHDAERDRQAARDAAFARQPGHERQVDRDINLRSVATTVLGILIGTIVSMIAMGLFLASLSDRAARRAPEPSPLPEARQIGLPPGPRLQARPELDLEQFRARENLLLSSYGWADRGTGTVRIPIERAMELLVERGAEVTPPQPGPLGPAGEPLPATRGAFGTNQEGADPEGADGQGTGRESGATQGLPQAGDAGTASGAGDDSGSGAQEDDPR
ncbi:MAG TPA: hypothetical protein VHQ65_00855 [Thermoanaerobaculia bacterium]|nr:hypothetical protein [Thermoanaerobaculia bacterium]